jgi:hypothetical protein
MAKGPEFRTQGQPKVYIKRIELRERQLTHRSTRLYIKMPSDAGRLELLVAKAKSAEHAVLQYIRHTDRLCLWPW